MHGEESPKRILILTANPIDTARLRLDKEVREIDEGLRRAEHRDKFELMHKWAVRPRDVQRAMLQAKPNIVHFSGHGEGEDGLVFEGSDGKFQLVSGSALASLFKLFSTSVECVILNGCYSAVQAEAIAEHIPYVIGMSQGISDKAALEFAISFYDALGAGELVEFAYQLGCNALQLENIPEEYVPVLLKKGENSRTSKVGPAKVFISYRSKDPDQSLAQAFHDGLKAAGHQVFMAAESIRLGDNWPQQINTALGEADYFLLLLSPRSATSEMVLDEVRKAKEYRNSRSDHRPVILPVRVNFSINEPLNYDLRNYLRFIQQREWTSEKYTGLLLDEISQLISEGRQNDIYESENPDSLLLLEDPKRPPHPVAGPEIPMGQVDIASKFYVERPPIEQRCFDAILQPGALIRIKAPRQMGKTSLMARILYRAVEAGYKTVSLSLQLADESVLADLSPFLKWFCYSITSELGLPDCLEDYWHSRIGSKMSCTNYFERYLLSQVTEPIVLGIDEEDLIFKYKETASGFLGLLRAWHERGKSSAKWKNLRLVIVHSTEVYIPLNMHQSPFNVGLPIELQEFTEEQMLDLARRHGLNWKVEKVRKLMSMIGGHPYLVREALYHIAQQDLTLDELLETAFAGSGIYGDHLRRHWWNLSQHPELAEAMGDVVLLNKPVKLVPIKAFQLHSMGLVNMLGNGVIPRCDLYRQYFRRNRLRDEG